MLISNETTFRYGSNTANRVAKYFKGIKFRGDIISRQKSLRNPRNFIPAKILNEKIFRKRQKLSKNRMNLKENARNVNEIREIKSPRKLQIDETAKSAKINSRKN